MLHTIIMFRAVFRIMKGGGKENEGEEKPLTSCTEYHLSKFMPQGGGGNITVTSATEG